MGLFINIILFCGYKTYRKMESVEITMSLKTEELNNQLFRTLIFQTLVPMLTMFTPVALLVILPMFSINVGTFANAPSLNAGIYPALDATIAIFMIRDFRETVICCRPAKITASTSTSGVRYSISPDS
ncbi:hypothetical protein B9Z55_017610 [Caenorhabditis nigoni]|uniref:7TM GPCR serpentine receptor class x (Srx) domain-containing protein n=2 Tax=Caenorhabditis nigoni TaxID=1611254 RepID=A0A2G5TA73_9PELO|nr:hypothetical protein B9Z55_017610 [Caenorhabditis nigoni]